MNETLEKLISTVVYDQVTRSNDLVVLGTVNTMFPDWKSYFVKTSKTNAERATVLFKKDGKMVNVVMSPRVTQLYRDNKITENEIVGFPVFYITKNELGEAIAPRLSLGLPPTGWILVSKIVLKPFVPSAITHEELIA